MFELIAIAGLIWLAWLLGVLCVGFVALLIQPDYRFHEVNNPPRVNPQG